jgi:hypothetical protein
MLKRADPGISLGLLFFLVFLSDFLLGVFYYAGWERAIVGHGRDRLVARPPGGR